MMKFLKGFLSLTPSNRFVFFVVILLAFSIRLYLLSLGHHEDLFSNAGWGEWIYYNGFRDFYKNNVWIYSFPTQLPLVNIIYFLNFIVYAKIVSFFSSVNFFLAEHNFLPSLFSRFFNFFDWFAWTYYKETPYTNGFLLVMKIVPFFSDLFLGILVFVFSLSFSGNFRKALFYMSLFLFSPFSWYVSSLWGQYDQTAVLLLVLSLLFLYFSTENKRFRQYFLFFSVLFISLSLMIKPNLIFGLPVFILFYLKTRPSSIFILFNLFFILLFFVLTIIPFSGLDNPVYYFINVIFPKVFNSDRGFIGAHVFNFWKIFYPVGNISSSEKFFGLPVFLWFLLIYIFFLLKFLKLRLNLKSIFGSSFLIYFVSFVFGVGNLERYLYPSVVALLFLVIIFGKYVKYWLLVAFCFSFNLFFSWGFPFLSRNFVNNFWDMDFAIRIFSAFYLLIYLYLFRLGVR